MADIEVNIIDGVANITQQGFGIPALFGETEQFNVLRAGTGKSQLVLRSESRGETVSFEIVAGAGLAWTDTGSKVTLTLDTGGNTAKEAFDDFTDNAPSTVKDLVVVTLSSSGSGALALLAETSLADTTEFVITDKTEVSNLLPSYLDTDPEFLKMTALFNQDLKPEKAFVFNGFSGSTPPALATILPTFVNQDYYFLMLTDLTKARAIEGANFAEANEKLLIVSATDSTLLDDLVLSTAAAVWLRSVATVHPEAAIVGLQAPKTPGSTTWKFQRVNGIAPETDATLITDARTKNGNIFIETSGETFSIEGFMTNGKFIDQKRSRDFVTARLEEALLRLFIEEDKIPYDDVGITQVISTVSDSLQARGDDGIIAVAVSAVEVEKSFNGVFQYTINAPSRAQVVASNPTNITNRLYEMTFEYVEAGAIHNVQVTGKIVLALT